MRDLDMQIDKQVLVSTLLINILHMHTRLWHNIQKNKLLFRRQVITAYATYAVLRHTFLLSTIVRLTQACLIINHFQIHYQVISSLLKDCLVWAKSKTVLRNELVTLVGCLHLVTQYL